MTLSKIKPPVPAQRRRGITKRIRETFLEALTLGYSLTHAAEHAGRSRRRFHQLAQDDAEFGEAMRDAIEAGSEVLIDEARRRAVDGWDEEVYQGGSLVGTVRRYDSKLLAFLIAGRRPEYRAGGRLEVTGAGGGPIEHDGRVIGGFADIAALALSTGQGHLFGLQPADVVDGDAEELPALDSGDEEES